MEYVKLGDTGLDVSRICLGCMSFGTAENWVHNQWALHEEGSRMIIKKARDIGFLLLFRNIFRGWVGWKRPLRYRTKEDACKNRIPANICSTRGVESDPI